MSANPSSHPLKYVPRLEVLEDRRLLNARALLELEELEQQRALAELAAASMTTPVVVDSDLTTEIRVSEAIKATENASTAIVNPRLSEELKAFNANTNSTSSIRDVLTEDVATVELPSNTLSIHDPVVPEAATDLPVDRPIDIETPIVPVPTDPPEVLPPLREVLKDRLPLNTTPLANLGARTLLLEDAAPAPVNVSPSPTTVQVPEVAPFRLQLNEAVGPVVAGTDATTDLTNTAGLVETGLVAVVLGLNDADMFAAEVGATQVLNIVAESSGVLSLASPGFDLGITGAGLAEYIPALDAAALNLALAHPLSGLDLNDRFFSWLGSMTWKHVATASIVLTTAYLAIESLRPRRRPVRLSREALEALAWTPQLAGIAVS
jgi:hypothetical protein